MPVGLRSLCGFVLATFGAGVNAAHCPMADNMVESTCNGKHDFFETITQPKSILSIIPILIIILVLFGLFNGKKEFNF